MKIPLSVLLELMNLQRYLNLSVSVCILFDFLDKVLEGKKRVEIGLGDTLSKQLYGSLSSHFGLSSLSYIVSLNCRHNNFDEIYSRTVVIFLQLYYFISLKKNELYMYNK